PPRSPSENRASAALRNDEIAVFRPARQHAQPQAADRFAKHEKRVGRNAALRDRANTTEPVRSPLPGRESAPSREFAILPPCRAPGRLQPTQSRGHTIA